MFFVGGTGQLITLILTVCLPLVLLFSANPQAEAQSPANYFSAVQVQHVISISENATVPRAAEFEQKENEQPFVFHDKRVKQKIPVRNAQIRWNTDFFTSSGNKAPPVKLGFNC